EHDDPLLGTSRHEIAAIAGGASHNVIPDRCSVRIEIKAVSGQSPRAIVADLDRLAASHGGLVELVEVTEPFATPADSPLVAGLDRACMTALGHRPERIGVPAWTDAHNFVAFGGAEAVVFGPGDFATAHTPE